MSKDFRGTVFNLCDELRWSNYRLLIVERSYFRCLEIWRLGGLELKFESGVFLVPHHYSLIDLIRRVVL